jgi:tRNA(adenine34) deaminase
MLKILSADEKIERDEAYMREAFTLARQAEALGEVPVGCILVHDALGVVGRGHNLRETSHDPTAHAEMLAIRDAYPRLQTSRFAGVTAYVTLEPCPMCAGALVLARVSRVVYACTDAKAGAVDTLFAIGRTEALNHQFEVTRGVLAEQSTEMLQAFFRRLRAHSIT